MALTLRNKLMYSCDAYPSVLIVALFWLVLTSKQLATLMELYCASLPNASSYACRNGGTSWRRHYT
eukprot:8857166-Pyramimonas_sp.AAC.1